MNNYNTREGITDALPAFLKQAYRYHLLVLQKNGIHYKLMRYLEDHQLISDRQYGFRRGRSAGDILVYLTHRWAEAVESKGKALVITLDIAKAFDPVWHKALLSKLPSYGFPDKLCN